MSDLDLMCDKAIEILNALPDATGLVRCAYFYQLYEVIMSIKRNREANAEELKNEKLILEAKIKDLEEMLASAGKE